MKNPTCPVCGMEIAEIETAPASVYKGQTYYFCSSDCKAAFDTAPEKYAGQDRPEAPGSSSSHLH